MTRSIIIFAIAVAVLAGGAGAVLSSSGSLSTETPEPEEARTSEASPTATARFAALSDASRRRDARETLTLMRSRGTDPERVLRSLGLRSDAVSSVYVSDGLSILLGPGSGGLCTITTSPTGAGGGCFAEAASAEGKAFSVRGCLERGDLTVYGVVPDDVTDVTVVLDGGDTRTVPVRGNVAVLAVSKGTSSRDIPRSVRWAAGEDRVQAELPMPPKPNC